MVRTHARLRPHDIGAMDSRRSLSFAQWNQRADLLAAGLLSQGLNPGDRVAVLAHNCIEWMEIYVALARAGLVALPINFRLVGHEIAYILADAQATALLCTALLQDKVLDILPELGLKACVQIGGTTHAGWLDYEGLMTQASLPAQWPTGATQRHLCTDVHLGYHGQAQRCDTQPRGQHLDRLRHSHGNGLYKRRQSFAGHAFVPCQLTVFCQHIHALGCVYRDR